MAPTEEARLSTLFGSELGGRLAKLCLDVDTPTEQAPGGTTPASPIKQQDQANSRPAPDGGDGILHGQIKKASNPRGSGPGGVFQRASSLPSNAPAAGGGQGIFDKIRRASSSRFDDPLVAERPPSRQPHDSGRKHPASGGAAHSHGSRPGSAASAASAEGSSTQSSRRAEMAARAQAAARRQQRRAQEANGGNSDRPPTPSGPHHYPGSSARELYTVNIEYHGARKLLFSVILTRTEFNTFTFSDLRARAAEEQHWGAGEIVGRIQ
eukprot:jgi/Tetstr1/436008/TSEL_024887.t2